ncbi:Crp/Fnr family transcriptional regulator [Carboxylicivirga sp. N1Y90]|uniref:Crp/Fnr family transcriptional regulator n=1 Tax=Carboxylicivirga fragile TaxID=3417571 RepID=UPI003D3561EC|nr:Crp/Fnr family transcriptional regulator [Marinilabiliaceae bacterium N1Y90]
METNELLASLLTKYGGLDIVEIQSIIQHTNQLSFKKGAVILEENKVANMCYFVLKGCIRQYQFINGEEKTISFFTDEEAVISYDSYLHNKPSSYSLSCIEDTILIGGSKEQELQLLAKHPRLSSLTQLFIQNDFSKVQERLASFINQSPEERYLKLLENQASLLTRVPLQYLASYIGVKPESFSRMRRRILLKEKN